MPQRFGYLSGLTGCCGNSHKPVIIGCRVNSCTAQANLQGDKITKPLTDQVGNHRSIVFPPFLKAIWHRVAKQLSFTIRRTPDACDALIIRGGKYNDCLLKSHAVKACVNSTPSAIYRHPSCRLRWENSLPADLAGIVPLRLDYRDSQKAVSIQPFAPFC